MRQNLLTDAQLGNDSTVTLDVLSHQIVQHLAALTDHLQQATTGVVVLLVDLQVLGQLVDASGQNGDLNLGRTGVSGVRASALSRCGLGARPGRFPCDSGHKQPGFALLGLYPSLRSKLPCVPILRASVLPKELRNGRVKPCPLGQAVPRNEADGRA